jgi:hypothetical protein
MSDAAMAQAAPSAPASGKVDLISAVLAARAKIATKVALGLDPQSTSTASIYSGKEDLPILKTFTAEEGDVSVEPCQKKYKEDNQEGWLEAERAGYAVHLPSASTDLHKLHTQVEQAMTLFGPSEMAENLEYPQAINMIMADLDLDSQNPKTIREFLNKPVATVEDVLKLISSFDRSNTCRQFKVMAVKITEAFSTMQLVQTRLSSELKWLGGDARQMQVETSRVQALVRGYKSYIPAEDRTIHIFETLCKIPAVKEDVCWRMRLKHDAELRPEDLYCILAGDPVTVQYGEEKWSTVTVITFTDFGLRKKVCDYFSTMSVPYLHTTSTKPMKLSFKPRRAEVSAKAGGHSSSAALALSQRQTRRERPVQSFGNPQH